MNHTHPNRSNPQMDRCLLCGQDTPDHHETCPDGRPFATTASMDSDEVARGRAALDAHTARVTEPAAPAVPWSIPIRDAAVPTADPGPTVDAEHRRLLALVAGAAALLVVAIVGALTIGDDPGSPGPADVAGGQVTRPSDLRSTAPATSASTTGAPTTTEAPTTTTIAPTTTTTTAAPAPVDTGDVPILTPGQIGRGWVAQMSSVPRSAGGSALQTAYATVADSSPSAVVITSDEWPSLRRGYWVIVVPGFDTGSDAVGGCDAAGRSGDDCFARFLSSNADQNARSCARADDGSLSGDCGA